MQTIHEKIDAIIREPLKARGYRLVRVKLMDQYKRKTLQIMAERQADGGMAVEDCTQLNHLISALLDVEDPIEGRYDLEVSSPGIDRPLVTREDFASYEGHEAKIETNMLIEGRKRFKGELVQAEKETVSVRVDGEYYMIAYSAIASAQLVLTDALIKSQQETRADILALS